MPELVTPDGKPVNGVPAVAAAPPPPKEDIDREFSRAMAADDPGSAQPPPRREDKAQPSAEEPKRRRGRPTKDEKSRADKGTKASQKVDTDYTEGLVGLTSSVWMMVAGIPYTTPYALVIEANQPQLVAALNGAAQNNAQVREWVEKLSAGGGGMWAVQLAVVGANMSMQTLQIMKDPVLRQEAAVSTRAKLRAVLRAQGLDIPEEESGESSPVG